MKLKRFFNNRENMREENVYYNRTISVRYHARNNIKDGNLERKVR